VDSLHSGAGGAGGGSENGIPGAPPVDGGSPGGSNHSTNNQNGGGGGSNQNGGKLLLASFGITTTNGRDKSTSNDNRTSPLKRMNTASSYTSDVPANMTAIGAPSGTWMGTAAVQNKGVVMEGYLTKRGGTITSASLIEFRKEPWERRYFTLTSASNLFIYKNRQEYRTNPKAPMFTRPLRLIEYYIEVDNDDQTERFEDSDSEVPGSTVNGNKSSGGILSKSQNRPSRFQITLILRENVDGVDGGMAGASALIDAAEGTSSKSAVGANSLSRLEARYRNHWVLRCDTEEELRIWVGAMFELCPSCFQNSN
jgi:hypothetical protein